MSKTGRLKITQRMLDNLKPVAKEAWLMDSEVTGLGVRQRPGVKAIYAIRWKDRSGRDKKMRIGPVASIELRMAREIAKQRLGEIASGENPLDTKAKERHKQTIADLLERVAEELETKGRAAKYIRDVRQHARDYIIPAFGDALVRDVTHSDVDRLLAKHHNKPALHNRVKSTLSLAFKRAVRWGYRADDPTFGSASQHELPRERWLSDPEMSAILTALEQNAGQSSDALRLLYLTGSRPKELFSARWEHIDLVLRRWTKPAQYVKQRRTHVVELHPLVVAILKRIKEQQKADELDTPFVFPGSGASGHLTTVKKHAAVIFKAAGVTNVRPYDLRKAFASRLLASGTDLKTAMSLTGHTQVAVFLKHYAQFMPEKQGEALAKVFG